MLKIAGAADAQWLSGQLKGNAFAVKVGGLFKAYGTDSGLLDVWYHREGDKLLCAAARLESAMSLYCTDGCDYEETAQFLRAVGCEKLFAAADDIKKLSLQAEKQGAVMQYNGNKATAAIDVADGSDRIREIYSLICESIPGSFNKGGYLPFLSDFTYRQRRFLARVRCVISDGKLASCALVSAQTDNAAIISGVASAKEFRGKGCGAAVVTAIANELKEEGKTVYVFVLNEKAQGFYEKIGFTLCGEWSEAGLR